jgi:dimethylhistidine N-methyltransferase
MWSADERQTQPVEMDEDFAASALEGLSKRPKTLPCRFFYDARGSELFEQITSLPEYYLTRVETAILEAHAAEMLRGIGAGGVLVEFGSGSSRKTEILLNQTPQPSAYVPIDISRSALESAARRLGALYPRVDVRPLVGNFTHGVAFPSEISGRRKIGFFPGSTIGNFTPLEAINLLQSMRAALAPDGLLIIGVDLKKDADVLLRAYNDSRGVTAAFNLNLLRRANRELDADFELSAFRHEAAYDSAKGRIEMHIVSLKTQTAHVARQPIRFLQDETIHTENSYKYEIEQFHEIARSASWTPGRVWTDESRLFSVHELMIDGR